MAAPRDVTTAPPHPSSTLVNIAEDADARLIRVLVPAAADPPAFEAAAEAALAAGDAARLLRAALDHGAVAGLLRGGADACPADEAVGAVSLLAVYLDRVGDAAVARELCGRLAAAAAAGAPPGDGDGDADAGTRAAAVAALFNLRRDAGEKARLLAEVVGLADAAALTPGGARGSAPLADLLDAAELRAALARWEGGEDSVDATTRRALYRAVAGGMERVLAALARAEGDEMIATKSRAARERKQTYMLLLLDTYKDGSPLDAEATATAREAAIYAIRDPVHLFAAQQRILALPAVAALATSHPDLHELLRIFMEGRLPDYHAFAAAPAKAAVFSECGLDEAACRHNMRLLSLVSLAGEHEEVPYGAVAAALDVPAAEVERWVLRAVGSGLMAAKMDQRREVVLVERCAVRRFGGAEWRALKARLDAWTANVRGVLDALEKSGAIAAEGP